MKSKSTNKIDKNLVVLVGVCSSQRVAAEVVEQQLDARAAVNGVLLLLTASQLTLQRLLRALGRRRGLWRGKCDKFYFKY
jgi:hypothetical protein